MLGLNAAFQAIHGFSIADTLSPVGIGNVTAADLPGLSAALGTNVNPNLYNGDLVFFNTSRYDERQYAGFSQDEESTCRSVADGEAGALLLFGVGDDTAKHPHR